MLGDNQGPKKTRAALKAMLISITSDTHRQAADDSSETSAALRGLRTALDPYAGSDLVGEVPAKFAARVLARSARETSPMAFVQKSSGPANAGSYAPASGQILGILKQMKEDFETNLAASQKDEAKGQEDYANLKAAKENEMGAGKDQIEDKVQELADTDEKLAQAKQDLEDT